MQVKEIGGYRTQNEKVVFYEHIIKNKKVYSVKRKSDRKLYFDINLQDWLDEAVGIFLLNDYEWEKDTWGIVKDAIKKEEKEVLK